MPIQHILLFRIKDDLTNDQVTHLLRSIEGLQSSITGVLKVRASKALPITAPMAKGFNLGAIITLSKEEDLETLRTSPEHDRVSKLATECTTDRMIIDLKVEN